METRRLYVSFCHPSHQRVDRVKGEVRAACEFLDVVRNRLD